MTYNAVEPFALRQVHPRHHEAVFGNLEDSIERRLLELKSKRHPSLIRLVTLLEQLKRDVARDFAELQRKWLRPGALGGDDEMFKFFDLVYWCEGKFRIATRLGLDATPPTRIVDIGSGAAHFPYIGRQLGHKVIATDLSPTLGQAPVLQMYVDFRDMFGIPWIVHCTTIEEPLPTLGTAIDICTAHLTKFHVHHDGSAWSRAEWQTFLGTLRSRLLSSQPRLHFQLNQAHLTPDVWTYLEALADSSNSVSRHLYIESKLNLLVQTTTTQEGDGKRGG